MLREEWDRVAAMDCAGELDNELDLLGELRWETSQLIAYAKRRKTELRRAAAGDSGREALMDPFYLNSLIGCQFREIVKCFGSKPFVYAEVRALVPCPATLKKMEDYGWLECIGQVKVGRYWYNELRVVSPMKQWADEQEEKQRKKRLEQEKTPAGDDP